MEPRKKLNEQIVVPGWLSFDDAVTLWNKTNEGIPHIKYLFEQYQKKTQITKK